MQSDADHDAQLRENARQVRRRSIAIALALGGLVVLVFVMSVVRLHATFQ